MKTNFKHIALSYLILCILGIQTGMHFFHDHPKNSSYQSKVILTENTPDCLICSLHISSELFFSALNPFVFLRTTISTFLQVKVTYIYYNHFHTIKGRAPPVHFLAF